MRPSAPDTNPPAAPLRTTGDGSLFVLGEEGVFFSAPRQELYVFNTTATLVWCCVEAGMSEAEIVGYYADAMRVDRAKAWADITLVLDQWWGSGYIERPRVPPDAPLPFTTALARLLVNPRLRAEFASDPPATARHLRVDAAQLDAFVALDPSELDAQARRLHARSSRRQASAPWTDALLSTAVHGDRTPLDLAVEGRLRRIGSPFVEHRYRMLTTNVRVRYASAAQAERVHAALAHLEVEAPAEDEVTFEVIDTESGYVVLEDLVPRGYCRLADELTPIVKNLVSQTARKHHACFLEIHAGVVGNGDACILLPGASGSGKSTLTIGLVLSGFDYFSDEIALLDETTLDVRPFPLGLGIKPGAVPVLTRMCPEVASLDVHLREDGKQVRYLPPPMQRWVSVDAARPARWLVFPQYRPDVRTELRPIAPSEALRRLLHECTSLPQLLDETRVERLVRWMRNMKCFELPMSSLEEAVELVRDQVPQNVR